MLRFVLYAVASGFVTAVLDRWRIHCQHGTAVKKTGKASTSLVTAVTRGVLSPVLVFLLLFVDHGRAPWCGVIITGVTSPVMILMVVILVSFLFLVFPEVFTVYLTGVIMCVLLLCGRDQLHGKSSRA